jgi:hypothetical protein
VFFLPLIKHYHEDVLKSGGLVTGSLLGAGYSNLQQNCTFCSFVNFTGENYFCKNFIKLSFAIVGINCIFHINGSVKL